jgi:hypothetical protein
VKSQICEASTDFSNIQNLELFMTVSITSFSWSDLLDRDKELADLNRQPSINAELLCEVAQSRQFGSLSWVILRFSVRGSRTQFSFSDHIDNFNGFSLNQIHT